MKWRSIKEELPKEGEVVWVMLEPHKDRGTLLQSAQSIQICCGEVRFMNPGSLDFEVQNNDELGLGAIAWTNSGGCYGDPILAWMSVEDMPLLEEKSIFIPKSTEEMDNKIDEWRALKNITLHGYLGWTWDQYSHWVENNEFPKEKP